MSTEKRKILIINSAGVRGTESAVIERHSKYLPYASSVIVAGLRKNGKDYDKNLEDRICHLILSHHGRYEYGSPRLPMIVEACILHQADLMDSQVKNYIQSIEDSKSNSDDEWAFVWDSDLGSKKAMYLGDY